MPDVYGERNDERVRAAARHTLTDAVAHLSNGHPRDLILLDLTLPDNSGVEMLTSIQGVAPDVPVVVMSGNEDVDVATAAVRHGAMDFLTKGTFDATALDRTGPDRTICLASSSARSNLTWQRIHREDRFRWITFSASGR